MLSPSDLHRIIFGCGNFGGIGSAPHLRSAGDSEEQALQLLDQARLVGLRRFDTANLAYSVGFSSEAAFNRAFKREFGDPPMTWKRKQAAGAGAQPV